MLLFASMFSVSAHSFVMPVASQLLKESGAATAAQNPPEATEPDGLFKVCCWPASHINALCDHDQEADTVEGACQLVFKPYQCSAEPPCLSCRSLLKDLVQPMSSTASYRDWNSSTW